MSKIKLIGLPYPDKLEVYYQKLAHLPGFVLLESIDRQRGRYDILSAYPYEWIEKGPWPVESTESCGGLPFQGGVIGFVSYDPPDSSKLPQDTLKDIPVMQGGLYDWGIVTDHHLKKVTLVAAHTQSKTAELVDEILSRWGGAERPAGTWQLTGNLQPLMKKNHYESAFHSIQTDLKKGRCYQVNLTQPFHVPYAGDSWSIYQQIRKQNPVPFAAFMRLPSIDILSFSPERFLRMQNKDLLTSPIKGSAKRSADPIKDMILRENLKNCPKNRSENIMIVDLMRNDLGRIAKTGSVRVKDLFQIESFEAVHHLVSQVHAECLDNLTPWEAFMSCFPGGSITGAPKLESMKVIAEQELYARGIYCGSIGYFSNHGHFDTNIAIRTLVLKQNIIHMAAGGGIVLDSICEEEYQECFIKLRGILNALYG